MGSMFETGRRAYDPSVRGYHAVYHENSVNRCPGCGRSHWLIGRMLAECGFCGTALPLSEKAVFSMSGAPHGRSGVPVGLAA